MPKFLLRLGQAPGAQPGVKGHAKGAEAMTAHPHRVKASLREPAIGKAWSVGAIDQGEQLRPPRRRTSWLLRPTAETGPKAGRHGCWQVGIERQVFRAGGT